MAGLHELLTHCLDAEKKDSIDERAYLDSCTCSDPDYIFADPGTLVGWLVGFLTSSSTTRLYRGRAPRQSV